MVPTGCAYYPDFTQIIIDTLFEICMHFLARIYIGCNTDFA